MNKKKKIRAKEREQNRKKKKMSETQILNAWICFLAWQFLCAAAGIVIAHNFVIHRS